MAELVVVGSYNAGLSVYSDRLRCVPSTGAGDAFSAGLVAALVRGEPMESAIDQGCRAGAFCVTRNGVIDGLGRPSDLAALG